MSQATCLPMVNTSAHPKTHKLLVYLVSRLNNFYECQISHLFVSCMEELNILK